VLEWRDGPVQLGICVLPSTVRSRGTLLPYGRRCDHPTDHKLFAGYIQGARGTASSGATWITPRNHLRAYCDLSVVVWVTVAGLGLTREAARLSGQPPPCQSQSTL